MYIELDDDDSQNNEEGNGLAKTLKECENQGHSMNTIHNQSYFSSTTNQDCKDFIRELKEKKIHIQNLMKFRK